MQEKYVTVCLHMGINIGKHLYFFVKVFIKSPAKISRFMLKVMPCVSFLLQPV